MLRLVQAENRIMKKKSYLLISGCLLNAVIACGATIASLNRSDLSGILGFWFFYFLGLMSLTSFFSYLKDFLSDDRKKDQD